MSWAKPHNQAAEREPTHREKVESEKAAHAAKHKPALNLIMNMAQFDAALKQFSKAVGAVNFGNLAALDPQNRQKKLNQAIQLNRRDMVAPTMKSARGKDLTAMAAGLGFQRRKGETDKNLRKRIANDINGRK